MSQTRNESVKVLITRALDEFNQIKEYHKLLSIASDDAPEHSELLLQCYQTLSQPHWEELEIMLLMLEKQNGR